MNSDLPAIDLADLRNEIIGNTYRFETPFGERLMLYADYTASGRNVEFIERYLMAIQESYANTHTEDDLTGRSTTEMLHRAENIIKDAVGGDDSTCIIAAGTGATGAIQKLQEILGVYVPPATRDFLRQQAARYATASGDRPLARFMEHLDKNAPVVFIGPFEHHSNELSWRESLAEVVNVGLDAKGGIDQAELEQKLSDPRYKGRLKIGSFSAASNVTGIRVPVYDVAALLHRHGALACFDFAASAPYVRIEMNRDENSYLDAVYFSPHKFLGGPGSCGILLFNKSIYRSDLPPTFAAGGTVDYVGPSGQEYTAHIETREKPGTPGTLQLLKAALAMELTRAIGTGPIEKRERLYIGTALERFVKQPGIEILGNPDPDNRLGIVSFSIRHGDRYLHPKLATRLLNDLFGIQSRAGCSCAGPYGHHLLKIDQQESERYRSQIGSGCFGIKPGWVRVGFHYTMDDVDVDYICSAVEYLAENGHLFLPLYRMDLTTGAWSHVEEPETPATSFGLAEALRASKHERSSLDPVKRAETFERCMAEARAMAEGLRRQEPASYQPLPEAMEELSFFHVVHYG